jgi:hypothetical protein
MARFPTPELASLVFTAGSPQFRDNLGVLRGEPVLQLIECFHRQEDISRDFYDVGFHQ